MGRVNGVIVESCPSTTPCIYIGRASSKASIVFSVVFSRNPEYKGLQGAIHAGFSCPARLFPARYPPVSLSYSPVHGVGDPFQFFLQFPNLGEKAPPPLLGALLLGEGVEPLFSPHDAQYALKGSAFYQSTKQGAKHMTTQLDFVFACAIIFMPTFLLRANERSE